MRRERVRDLLAGVAEGSVSIDSALDALSFAPLEEMSFATLDHHRALRQGFPEVIFGAGKTPEQIEGIATRLTAHGDGFLATRLDPGVSRRLAERFPGIEINEVARTAYLPGSSPPPAGRGNVLVVTAGTSDLPVAEEAVVTLRSTGDCVERLTDVGVAGIHRVLAQRERLLDAAVVIVVAGMDGALASVIGGLVRKPVIAVPTSIGYGAAFDGLAPLLTMLNSCAAGVAVVNIDNGFGAAMAASRITHA
jgi:NCAIR mutase (PurE)-related protein